MLHSCNVIEMTICFKLTIQGFKNIRGPLIEYLHKVSIEVGDTY